MFRQTQKRQSLLCNTRNEGLTTLYLTQKDRGKKSEEEKEGGWRKKVSMALLSASYMLSNAVTLQKKTMIKQRDIRIEKGANNQPYYNHHREPPSLNLPSLTLLKHW